MGTKTTIPWREPEHRLLRAKSAFEASRPAEPLPLPGVATVGKSGLLDRECRIFTRHLIGQDPNDYVRRKYGDAHRDSETLEDPSVRSFDALLLALARAHALTARIVDAYTRFFLRTSIFRRKSVLLLAILESCAPTYSSFEVPDAPTKLAFLWSAFRRMGVFFLVLAVAVVLLSPFHLAFAARSRLFARS